MKQIIYIGSVIFILNFFMNCSRQNDFVSVVERCMINTSIGDEGSVIYLWDIQEDSVSISINNKMVYDNYIVSTTKFHGKPILSFFQDKDKRYVINCNRKWEVSNLIKMNTVMGQSRREDVINLDTVKTILLYHDKLNNYIAIETLDKIISFE